MFLEFCKTQRLISEEEFKKEDFEFTTQICRLCLEQQNRYVPQSTNYLSLIAKAYKKGQFRIAKDVKAFDERKHDGVIHYACLCFYSKRFDSVMSRIISNYDHRQLVRYLKKENALKMHESDGKNDVKISGLNKRFFFDLS